MKEKEIKECLKAIIENDKNLNKYDKEELKQIVEDARTEKKCLENVIYYLSFFARKN